MHLVPQLGAATRSMVMVDGDLMKCSDLTGKDVVDPEHGKIGMVREVFMNRGGQAEFAIVELSTLLGSSKFHPVPWSLLHLDAAKGEFVSTLSKEELKAAPAYDRDQLASTSYGWSEQVTRFFEGSSVSRA